MSLPDCRDIAGAICKTPLHPSRLQRQPGFPEQFDCFLKFVIRLASIAFGASRFGRHPAESGAGLRIVIVLGNRIQNIKAVSGIARTIVVRIKRRREEKAREGEMAILTFAPKQADFVIGRPRRVRDWPSFSK